MTRPWRCALVSASVLLLPCLSAAQAPSTAALAGVRDSFLRHRIGEPYADVLLRSTTGTLSSDGEASLASEVRDVQEGCEAPCDTEAETALYRAKIAGVSKALSLGEREAAQAAANYFEGGVPRVRRAPEAGEGSGRPADAKRRKEMSAKAQASAEALGRSSFQAFAGGPDGAVVAGEGSAGRGVAKAGTGPGATPGPSGAPAAASSRAPPPGDVQRRFADALDKQASRYAAGREVLKLAPKRPKVGFKHLDSDDTYAEHDYKNGGTIDFNTTHMAEALARLDPASAKLDLKQEGEMARYLDAKPEMVGKVAAVFDALYIHEMTHEAQARARGASNLLTDTLNGWVDIFNGLKYPIEAEYEAFGTQNRYFHERVREDPSLLDLPSVLPFNRHQYEDYVRDLTGYRRGVASEYAGSVKPAAQLRFKEKEKERYDRVLAAEAADWPRIAIEGRLSLAAGFADKPYPYRAMEWVDQARSRAVESGNLGMYREEMRSLFTRMTAALEKGLGSRILPGGEPPEIHPSQKELLRRLSVDLGVPLPKKLAGWVGK